MKVTYIHSNDPTDELQIRLRCRNFADAINRVGWHSADLLDLDSFIRGTADAEKVCEDSDLLVIHRYLFEPVFQAIEYWKARDKKVIVDFDRGIENFSSEFLSHSYPQENTAFAESAVRSRVLSSGLEPTPLEQFTWGLGMVDAAIVSSARLAVDWSRYTDVHEVPDYLNTDHYLGFKQTHENEIWIGMANSVRAASLKGSGLLNALERVCEKRPNVKLVYRNMGSKNPAFQNISDEQMVEYQPDSFDEWSGILLKLDVGLLPICKDYDLQAGRIGLLEFMVSKIPWFASNQPNLRELSRYGRSVSNTSGIWETAILRAVDNIEMLRKRVAGEPFLYALSQDVNENIDKVLKLFTYILNQSK